MTYKEFLAALAAHQADDDVQFDKALLALNGPSGLVSDFAALNKTITDLQASQGQVTPEDQALIDAAEAKANAFSTKLSSFASAMAALDESTPPAPPAPPAE